MIASDEIHKEANSTAKEKQEKIRQEALRKEQSYMDKEGYNQKLKSEYQENIVKREGAWAATESLKEKEKNKKAKEQVDSRKAMLGWYTRDDYENHLASSALNVANSCREKKKASTFQSLSISLGFSKTPTPPVEDMKKLSLLKNELAQVTEAKTTGRIDLLQEVLLVDSLVNDPALKPDSKSKSTYQQTHQAIRDFFKEDYASDFQFAMKLHALIFEIIKAKNNSEKLQVAHSNLEKHLATLDKDPSQIPCDKHGHPYYDPRTVCRNYQKTLDEDYKQLNTKMKESLTSGDLKPINSLEKDLVLKRRLALVRFDLERIKSHCNSQIQSSFSSSSSTSSSTSVSTPSSASRFMPPPPLPSSRSIITSPSFATSRDNPTDEGREIEMPTKGKG